MSNTLVTYLQVEDNFAKAKLILDSHIGTQVFICKGFSLGEGPMAHQLVGKVTAYQGYDG